MHTVRPPRGRYGSEIVPMRNIEPITFGGFTAKELAVTGAVSFAITRLLGASLPGALVMGIGNMLWEAGSTNIAPGWKRYALGLFRKPHNQG
jgi:hypothetical protein